MDSKIYDNNVNKNLSMVIKQWCNPSVGIFRKIMWLTRMPESCRQHINFQTSPDNCITITPEYLANYLDYGDKEIRQVVSEKMRDTTLMIKFIYDKFPINTDVVEFNLLTRYEHKEINNCEILEGILLKNEKGYFINSKIADRLWYELFDWIFRSPCW